MENFKKSYPDFRIYENSINEAGNKYIFLVSKDNSKFIVIGKTDFKFLPASENVDILLENFPFLKPTTCGLKRSFGFGDRLGISTPGHIRAVKDYPFFPLFAQQSVRELERTGRTFKDVRNSAVLGCFQEGYKDGFGADADHIKEIKYLKQAADAGFTFFTIDPSDKIHNPAVMSEEQKKYILGGYISAFEQNYLNRRYHIKKTSYLIDRDALEELVITYGEAIDHIEECYKFLKNHCKTFDFEVSVDETSIPTTPLAHIFIVEELQRRNINFQSIAFRFPGHFEKGIDYNGDINVLKETFIAHQTIREKMGNYKISLHSGSDKLSIYTLFKDIFGDKIHIKTSGTSWIEAVKLIAMKDFGLFLEILKNCLKDFKENSASYEISAKPEKIDLEEIKDISVEDLFRDNNIRQIIHISYGSILGKSNSKEVKERFLKILYKYEEEYHTLLKSHLDNHLRLI
ncbi:MAG: tagaturonate epimerase family protein [bacterium]|nr:tagaturonate epimerase family protein [bacterium]